jgi:hypothetical protein
MSNVPSLAKSLGVDRSTVYRWIEKGMPVDPELAKAWAEARANRPVVEVDAQPLPVEGAESPYDVVTRLRKAEKTIAGEIHGLDEALKRARKDGDVSLAYKLSRSLRSAREEQRKAGDSL